MGSDIQLNKSFFMGVGLGYGHDLSDIGQQGSRSLLNSYNIALYASYRPSDKMFIDVLLSNQWLSFESHRYVSNNGNIIKGNRNGNQQFGFLSLAFEQSINKLLLSPYVRLDLANAKLYAYSEKGAVYSVLNYHHQSVQTTRGNLGLRGELPVKKEYGIWLPTFRLEYGHEFQRDGMAAMFYPNILGSPDYFVSLPGLSRNYILFGPGLKLETLKGWLLRFEYLDIVNNASSTNQSVLFGIEKIFA
ncbi:MAG: autotransporter outer membrane beta-barrel domain-containing protein [Legionella sp.]|uniref:autotransporter outer membrane beta-barrel domain-containing protein n=1 Tax=Legionella sp. TaxID=459 RepID=UPI0039E4AA1D